MANKPLDTTLLDRAIVFAVRAHAVNRLAQYDPDIEPVAQALAPLDGLKATTVAQMDEQMTSLKDKIHAARTALIK